MIAEITTHDGTGKLLVTKRIQAECLEAVQEPYVMGWHDPQAFYVLGGEVVPRPDNPTVLIGMELHNVPLPSTIWIEGLSWGVTDNIVFLDFPLPGVYIVFVDSFPWRGATFEVTQI